MRPDVIDAMAEAMYVTESAIMHERYNEESAPWDELTDWQRDGYVRMARAAKVVVDSYEVPDHAV